MQIWGGEEGGVQASMARLQMGLSGRPEQVISIQWITFSYFSQLVTQGMGDLPMWTKASPLHPHALAQRGHDMWEKHHRIYIQSIHSTGCINVSGRGIKEEKKGRGGEWKGKKRKKKLGLTRGRRQGANKMSRVISWFLTVTFVLPVTKRRDRDRLICEIAVVDDVSHIEVFEVASFAPFGVKASLTKTQWSVLSPRATVEKVKKEKGVKCYYYILLYVVCIKKRSSWLRRDGTSKKLGDWCGSRRAN